ncbi:kinase-like domain-containing protein [Boeremia exigua]|uniref:kinase-like domain-containing protein n=1 Tax=Boeremia exigua TaxID=749465 RepID=UPI001E8D07B2|nr:kinase-like domain-containing protein [Boeremia exigua]KAH6625332.1 kinase-like domain-containing protein [Boeremia exigua]
MVRNPYQKFLVHATLHLKSSRHTWSSRERQDTIVVVYHTEPTVREYYANNDGEIPTLNSFFPRHPYSKEDAVEARSHAVKPRDLAAVHVPPIAPTARPGALRIIIMRPQVDPQVDPQVEPQVELPETPSPADDTEGSPPYAHWPAYPWNQEPVLPDTGARDVSVEKQIRFLATDPHLSENETHWHGTKYLGHGASAAVGLWCEVDQHGNVIERMVVKENATVERDVWRDPKNWRDRLPREIAVVRRIAARRAAEPDACQHIVRYRGHRMLMSKRRFRLYTDFSSGGDMSRAMTPYVDKWNPIKPPETPRDNGEDKAKGKDIEKPRPYLPEGFIWHTIKALATACLLLQNGTLGNEYLENWKPIVHLDIQPFNILLDVQSKKRKALADDEQDPPSAGPSKRRKGAASPTEDEASSRATDPSATTPASQDQQIVVQLTDFGQSFFELDFSQCPELDENPHDFLLPSPDFRYAPEHHHYDSGFPSRLNESTDVWGIGRVAWFLIVNRNSWNYGPVREGGPILHGKGCALPLSAFQTENTASEDRYDQEVLVGTAEWAASNNYSEELKALVRSCLKYYQEHRPSLQVILSDVNKHLQANPHLAEAMDVGSTELAIPDNAGWQIGAPLVVQPPS